MQDAALDWLHSNGVSSAHLTGYESSRWWATHGGRVMVTWTSSPPGSAHLATAGAAAQEARSLLRR